MRAAEVAAWSRQYRPAPHWAEWADTKWDIHDFPLLVAQYDHQRWIRQVIDAGDGQSGLNFLPFNDHHDCRFGLWYDGHGSTQYGHLPEFSAVKDLHLKLHEIGPEIVRLNHAGQFAAASALQPDLLAMQDTMQLQLASLQRAVAEQYACLPHGMHYEDADA